MAMKSHKMSNFFPTFWQINFIQCLQHVRMGLGTSHHTHIYKYNFCYWLRFKSASLGFGREKNTNGRYRRRQKADTLITCREYKLKSENRIYTEMMNSVCVSNCVFHILTRWLKTLVAMKAYFEKILINLTSARRDSLHLAIRGTI